MGNPWEPMGSQGGAHGIPGGSPWDPRVGLWGSIGQGTHWPRTWASGDPGPMGTHGLMGGYQKRKFSKVLVLITKVGFHTSARAAPKIRAGTSCGAFKSLLEPFSVPLLRKNRKCWRPRTTRTAKTHPRTQDAPKTLPGYPQDALRRPKKAQGGPRRKNVDFPLVLEAFLGD